jgi:hypothetical protein
MTEPLRSPCADDCVHPDHAKDTPRTESAELSTLAYLAQCITRLENVIYDYKAHCIETQGADYPELSSSQKEYVTLLKMGVEIYKANSQRPPWSR